MLRKSLLLLAIATLAVVAAPSAIVAPPHADAAFPGENGKIAFTTSIEGRSDADIFTIEPSGSGEASLLGGPAHEREAAWSADGRKIAFTRQELNSVVAEIWTANSDGTGQVRVAEGPGVGSSTWSPHGGEIAFAKDGGIGAVHLATGTIRQITPTGSSDGGPEWSPDGTKVAFSRSTSTAVHIWIVNADGS